jgi:hypothetical protein
VQKERQKDRQKMKEKKENQIPAAMLANQEPAKKIGRLVLPEPQITDQVLYETVFTFIRHSVVNADSVLIFAAGLASTSSPPRGTSRRSDCRNHRT